MQGIVSWPCLLKLRGAQARASTLPFCLLRKAKAKPCSRHAWHGKCRSWISNSSLQTWAFYWPKHQSKTASCLNQEVQNNSAWDSAPSLLRTRALIFLCFKMREAVEQVQSQHIWTLPTVRQKNQPRELPYAWLSGKMRPLMLSKQGITAWKHVICSALD